MPCGGGVGDMLSARSSLLAQFVVAVVGGVDVPFSGGRLTCKRGPLNTDDDGVLRFSSGLGSGKRDNMLKIEDHFRDRFNTRSLNRIKDLPS